MAKNKKIKRKLKVKSFFKFLLFILVIGLFVFYLSSVSIRNIYIKGNELVSDAKIISIAKIKNYPKLFKYSSRTIKHNILKIDLIESCKVSKNIFGRIVITVKETKPLFYNRENNNYVLSNGKTTVNDELVGIPFLNNYSSIPKSIYTRMIEEFTKINSESIRMISEIEYSPSMSKETIIDDTRFLLRMNDGNEVYVNLINIERLNSYYLIYTALQDKGVLELDSDNENVVFKSYKSIIENQKVLEENENE